ncbi:MAG: hypothetical protein A3G33_06715 [Omnitrophica bacterium RIFCSPLOWO2_12_FULL_44_17]|uniref:Uncharacterized protein n=1 Tax=Candidatus Danuiimicrobium aquiferis TaxID=1801832 RepID=A0A1G1L2M2_9BACT|nr:MAG: hypothetical protein A3B72_03295 [Omnitrophica bacterium RIFCSPHIGHO2_02_FULL_45_28]OGW91843.1 MAG: hypothetical protein A3E74_03615 [Omnitrophica bacterium RIFCSPHIGHO2_12_FULL_44_12]OGW99374.1 MAG: hypothetical protein A3G33_06715 [Omnitrophica bacterium RIFCSPLOWO2_12_FULL_44_17]OGX02050.1 MAG: hypothetical protein A3J12_01390 [Omnitrophica bacterium RIFCSPLOWO2_02_FULL_44_11]
MKTYRLAKLQKLEIKKSNRKGVTDMKGGDPETVDARLKHAGMTRTWRVRHFRTLNRHQKLIENLRTEGVFSNHEALKS